MTDEVISAQTFKLKGRLYTLTVVHIFNTNLVLFAEQLAELVQRAPRLFEHTPVILDCSALVGADLDLLACCKCLRQFGLYPIAIQGGSESLLQLAQQQGLPQLHGSAHHDKTLFEAKVETEVVPLDVSETAHRTKIFTTPIRSGQQIVSKDGDLVITSSVSHGAELLAEGHIHVYGTLRGRALAGITGDKNARIFCHALDAELIAIAGIYCLSDAMKSVAGPCQIFLQDDRIQIELI